MNLNSLHISRTATIGLILGLIVIAAIVYTLMGGTEPEETISISDPAATESEANFATLANELDSIVFDTTILTDPRFTSLMNIHTAITPEPQGRPDPFAPIGQ